MLDGSLRGSSSIGNVVKNRIDELETERAALTDYITASADRADPAAQGLPPIWLIMSSWEMPCRSPNFLISSMETGSGNSRAASSAACV